MSIPRRRLLASFAAALAVGTALTLSAGLVADVVPAKLTPFIDINDNAQLNKFGLHNGVPNDRTNLSEKWEGMGLLPALDPVHPNDYVLFVVNDNDFLSTNGFQGGAPYKAEVYNDTVMLAYRVTLPK